MCSGSVFLKSILAVMEYTFLYSTKVEIYLCTQFSKHFKSVSSNEIGLQCFK